MTGYTTLLFDLDGTLTDSTEGILKCLVNAIEQMGFEVPEDTNKFLGPPIRQSFAEFCGMNEEQTAQAVKIFRERYSKVATRKPQVYAIHIFDRFGLSQYFEFVGGAELDGSRDYKDEVIEYVLAQTGITDRSSVLMIGDRRQDVLGAHKTGIKCMGILWGYGSTEELTEAGADYIAETPDKAAEAILFNS